MKNESSNNRVVRELFENHGAFLRIIISLHISNEFDADDFFQELFLFLTLKPIPKNIRSIRGFLNKVVSDRVKDFYRRKGRYSRRISKYAEICRDYSTSYSPDSSVISNEESNKVFDFISRNLPPKEAQAVMLRHKYNFNNDEIAERMQINSRSASRYVSVGMSKIRAMWA
ncbi:MAG: sigma-70 family RNA polymerase sigma factor [Sedimentisphaerales bacterium]|nr:sigma-70 family RNA polymerase sigma factor [Sedimentisphaerales bacterium]